MLPRSERLCKRSDFLWLQQKGKLYRSKLLRLVLARKNPPARLIGFTVSKRISKKAVERNRLKRQLRSACRSFLPLIAGDVCLLFIAQGAVLNCSFAEIQAQMGRLLEDAGVLMETVDVASANSSD